MTASVPHRPVAHSMLFPTMYSMTVTLFSQIDHYVQKPCAAVAKGTLFIYNIGSDGKHSLYALNINAQAANVWQIVIIHTF